MAISPPSDIVLDVARAADPARYEAAVQKLAEAGASGDVRFSEVLKTVDGARGRAGHEGATGIANLRAAFAGKEAAAADRSKGAYREFEAFFLQSFVQMMLPDDASAIYGRGATGEFWKSLLAENLGKELAEAGGVGIADRLAERQAAIAERAHLDQGSARSWALNLPYLDPSFPGFLSDLAPAADGELSHAEPGAGA